MLDKAIKIASVSFEGKYDKGGKPYILHCLHVMDAVKHLGERYMIVGVLHDLIEDTEWTAEMLWKEGFDSITVNAIDHMTHKRGDDYFEYIRKVAMDPISKEIKKADLKHNSDITRMKGLRKKDFDRLEKYHKAFEYLKD